VRRIVGDQRSDRVKRGLRLAVPLGGVEAPAHRANVLLDDEAAGDAGSGDAGSAAWGTTRAGRRR